MQPGRELDALVAEKVMGWTKFVQYKGAEWRVGEEYIDNGDCICIPVSIHRADEWRPSNRIQDAWTVVEKLSERFQFWLEFYREDKGPWCAVFFEKRDSYGEVNSHGADAETAPHAICLAALKAVGMEDL